MIESRRSQWLFLKSMMNILKIRTDLIFLLLLCKAPALGSQPGGKLLASVKAAVPTISQLPIAVPLPLVSLSSAWRQAPGLSQGRRAHHLWARPQHECDWLGQEPSRGPRRTSHRHHQGAGGVRLARDRWRPLQSTTTREGPGRSAQDGERREPGAATRRDGE